MNSRIFVITAAVVVLALGGLFIYKSSSSASTAEAAETLAPAAGDNKAAAANPAADGSVGWKKRCAEDKEAPGKCEAFFVVTDSKSKKRFMELAFGYPEKGKDVNVVFVLPLGIVVATGGTIQADEDKEGKKFQILTCVPDGCVAKFNLDKPFMDKLVAAKTMTVGIMQTDGKPLNVKMPLDNFAATLAEVKQ